MRNWGSIHSALNLDDIIGCPLDESEYQSVLQRWLELYFKRVKTETGNWTHNGYHWHAYTSGFEKALEGDVAVQAFQEKLETRYLIYFASDHTIFDCVGPQSPDLSEWSDEVYLFPHDLSWSMLFTHEYSTGIGPFYTTLENKCAAY